ncbi:hypothetical protein ACIQU4_27315 [Streptomyces sp. NPDC090741]|uniref:hypothetical protein n=1 Tax=Streptomyces sp. NPDC090741 TaxID=3365967 RepID=UPI003819F505
MELSHRAARLPMTISRTGNGGRTGGSRVTAPIALGLLPGQAGARVAQGRGRAGAQTPETVPAGTPYNARRLVGATAAGRVYVTGKGERLRIESADGRMAFSLPTVPDGARQGARDGFAAFAEQLVAEVEERGEGMPAWSACQPEMWQFEPPAVEEFAPAGYTPGVMLAWTVAGVAYTGQVWANRVGSGAWNGWRGTTSAVVVATIGGRRARRDEAVCLPLLHGKKHPQAVVVTAGGNTEVEVIAPQRACEGLFDMVTTAGDPVEGWEAEGGYVPDAGPADDLEGPAAAVEPAPAEASEDVPPVVPEGRHCPRCDRNALYGIECSYCGHIIITAWEVKPCHPPAWFEGCCPTCFTADPEVWEISGRLGCTVCADGHSRWGTRVQAGPGWRERSRRVVAWTDNPGEKAYATAYADLAGLAALAGVVSPL